MDNSGSNAWRDARLPFVQYRPKGPDTPLAAANLVTQAFLAAFDDRDIIDIRRPSLRTGDADTSGLKTFDYLVGGSGSTYFVAALPAAHTIIAVECNRTVTFLRAQVPTEVGALSSYEGTSAETETPSMSAWPASVLQGAPSEATQVTAPGDAQLPWWTLLAPAVEGIALRSGDFVLDDLGVRYVISSAELTACGWRITAQQTRTLTAYFCTAPFEPLIDITH